MALEGLLDYLGLGAGSSGGLYAWWQTRQNKSDISDMKKEMHEIKEDQKESQRDTVDRLARLETKQDSVAESLRRIESHLLRHDSGH